MDFEELERQKLIKKLDWLELEYKFNSSIIEKEDSHFLKEVAQKKKDLNIQDPEPKTVPNIKIEESVSESLNNNDNIQVQNIDPSLKKIYREIVKLTHPDKSSDPKMNQLYLSATSGYESGNLDELYLISLNLGIKLPDEIEVKLILEKKIKEIEDKINFLKTTFTWKWLNSKSESERNSIIEHFIRR